MLNNFQSTSTITQAPLPLTGIRAYLFQTLLVTLAVVIPLILHSIHAPVRYLVPMHWIVILAGLAYGWRGGLITGIFSPLISYAISGAPALLILPSMTIELATYGFVAGWLCERTNLPNWLSIVISLLTGRIVFIISVVLLDAAGPNLFQYFIAALTPGIIAATIQVLFLPIVSRWWVNREHKYK